jgi:nifR3 family TIM-barrel protein
MERPSWSADPTWATLGPMPRRHDPLTIGPIEVWPPVVLAPMAGVTNPAFRRLCRGFGAGLYVSEMVTARGLVEGAARTFERAAFDPDESPRSIQLYGTDPATIGEAVRRLVDEGRVDHVDLNLGCPVRKITRHGGGAALTARPRLLAAIVGAATGAAGAATGGAGRPVPVTVKIRLGVDDRTVTYLDAGRVAEGEGAAAVALHGRTAAQLYSGAADWTAIARLREAVTTIPVLGNGDVWSAGDALRMMDRTGCHGVVIGRGCLGRPWLFRDLVDAFEGRTPRPAPTLGTVADILAEHARLLVVRLGAARAVRDIRKHIGWYLTGYPVGATVRRALTGSTSIDELRDRLARLPRDLTIADGADALPRGTQRGPQQVALPHGWLRDTSEVRAPSPGADALVSGG